MPERFRKIVMDEVGSTNRAAFQYAERGERGPLWIMARRQTAGRGRSGRRWVSEPGNLYATLLVDLACAPADVPQLSLVAGVATADAVTAVSKGVLKGLRLKWPNDLLIGGAKCAGILAESAAAQGAVTAVLGIGINLAWHPAELAQSATNLKAHGVDVSPDAMLEVLAPTVAGWLDVWQCGAGFAVLRQAWIERAGPVGERCSVNTGSERIEGAYLGLDESGALLMQDRNGRHRAISFGDVMVSPSSAGSSAP